ncbi:MAG: muramoyltetrapeptide carboxypeptidase [Crocinitomicaceae bacterium]|jgi:muramoyltetrapeptide carboxypeptidase
MNRRSFIPLFGTALLGASCLSVNEEAAKNLLARGIKFPKKLKVGDTIGIAAPAGPIRDRSEVTGFIDVLHKLGFKTKVAPHTYGQFGFFSATDEVRGTEFMELMKDETIDGIFFIRGGWGCARILEYLDFDAIEKNPKVIMGFSDITTLLNAISAKTGLVTFHGPSGNSTWNDYSLKYLKDVLMHGKSVLFSNQKGLDLDIVTYSGGLASGDLYGGNLSVICGLVGSEYLPDWRGKILFLEDVMEEPYRIDRMLTQLKLAGVFNQVSGIVLGNFRKCGAEEPDRSFTLEEVFEQHFSSSKVPVFYGAQIGHVRNKFTVPVGIRVSINADLGTIEMSEPSVQ